MLLKLGNNINDLPVHVCVLRTIEVRRFVCLMDLGGLQELGDLLLPRHGFSSVLKASIGRWHKWCIRLEWCLHLLAEDVTVMGFLIKFGVVMGGLNHIVTWRMRAACDGRVFFSEILRQPSMRTQMRHATKIRIILLVY